MASKRRQLEAPAADLGGNFDSWRVQALFGRRIDAVLPVLVNLRFAEQPDPALAVFFVERAPDQL